MKRYLLILLVVLVIFSLVACGTNTASTITATTAATTAASTAATTAASIAATTAADATTQPPTADQTVTTSDNSDITFGFVAANLAVQFPLDLITSCVKTADENGYKYLVLDGQSNVQKQLEGIEDWVASKAIDAIIIEPSDSDAIIPAVELCNEAGIPVITCDNRAYGGKVECHIGSDNISVGETGAQYVIETLRNRNGSESGTVIVIGMPARATLRDRADGAKSVLSQYPDIEILEENVTVLTVVESQQLMEDLMQAHPPGTIDVVFACNSSNSVGAISAQEAAGRFDFDIVGVDDSKEQLEALQDVNNKFLATVVQFPTNMGQIGVESLIKCLNNEPVKDVTTDVAVITKESIADHIKFVDELYASLEPYRNF